MKGKLVRKDDGTAEWVAPQKRDSFEVPRFFTAYPYQWKEWTDEERIYTDPLDEFIRSPSLIPNHELIWHWEGAAYTGNPEKIWTEKQIIINIEKEPNRDLRRTRYQNEARINALQGKDYVNDEQVREATVNLHVSILEQEIERIHACLTEGLVPNPKNRAEKVPMSPDERNKLQNTLTSNMRLYHELTGTLKKIGGGGGAQVNVIVGALDQLMRNHSELNADSHVIVQTVEVSEAVDVPTLPVASPVRNAFMDLLDTTRVTENVTIDASVDAAAGD